MNYMKNIYNKHPETREMIVIVPDDMIQIHGYTGEIIRCQDCIYYDAHKECSYNNRSEPVRSDDYCSRGEHVMHYMK